MSLDIGFVDQSQLTVESELAISADARGVVVARTGSVSAHIKGPMVDEALDVYVPDVVKGVPFAMKILHKVTGGAVRWYAQRVAKSKASDAVDLELVPTAMQLLRLPPEVPVPGLIGTRLELRFCPSGVTTVAASHVSAAFDLRMVGPQGVMPFVLMRGGPVPPPGPPPAGSELVVDLSLDGLNALLAGAWRAGALDQSLATRA